MRMIVAQEERLDKGGIIMGNELRKVYTTLGASNHVKEDREINDYYATDPKAMELLLKEENFSKNIWECACGGGTHIKGFRKQRI